MKLRAAYFEELWSNDDLKSKPSADFWDLRAEGYNESLSSEDSQVEREKKVEAFLNKKLINQDSTVLDIGCGSGQLAVAHAKVVKKVIAIDFSEKMLDFAKENAQKAGVTNIDFIHSDWDSFQSEQTFDFIVASMSPAIQGPEHLDKMLHLCHGACYLSAFVERHGLLREKLYALTEQSYKRQFNKLNYIFNLLWTKNIFPEVSYETGSYTRVFPLEKAKEIYSHELNVNDQPEKIALIEQYITASAKGRNVNEELFQRKGELIWEMSSYKK